MHELSPVMEDLIYLTGCALRREQPSRDRVEAMDLDQLYRLSQVPFPGRSGVHGGGIRL